MAAVHLVAVIDAFSYRTTVARSITAAASQEHSRTVVSRLYASSSLSQSTSDSTNFLFPDLEALSTAPFMQQVQYGMELTTILENSSAIEKEQEILLLLKQSLQAQLSHSDGIRGFMVAYLSGNNSGGADGDGGNSSSPLEIPSVLLEAIQDQLQNDNDAAAVAAADDLVSLMCMNVIMPTAMISMHQDPEQSASSARTAERGLTVLNSVQQYNAAFAKNLSAIRQVAQQKITTGGNSATSKEEDSLVQQWSDFFDKWGYQERQAADIAKAMDTLLLLDQ